jgi:hypothetical protein
LRKQFLSQDTIREIKSGQRRIKAKAKQKRLSRKIERSPIDPPAFISVMSTYSHYQADLYRVGKVKRSGPKSLPKPPKTYDIVVRSHYEYLQPGFHKHINGSQRRFITDHMHYEVWRNLKAGGTGRHKAKEDSVFHQHLGKHLHVFAFLYVKVSNTHARAIIYDYGYKKNNNQKRPYYWVNAQGLNGGPPKPPNDLNKKRLKRSDLFPS